MNIIESMNDENLFGGMFQGDSWAAWKAVLKGIFNLEMDPEEREVFLELSGGRVPPSELVQETSLIMGRRSGKSRIASLVAVFLAAFHDFSPHLAPGETPIVGLVSWSRDHCRVLLNYIKAMCAVPLIRSTVAEERVESVIFKNGIEVSVQTCKHIAGRGYTAVCWICEEKAFWKSEGYQKDEMVMTAIRPSLATVPIARIINISTPYSQEGVLYQDYKRSYSQDDPDHLVLQGESLRMNPSLSEHFVERELAKDPTAESEWKATFRKDVSSFVSMQDVEACTDAGISRRSPVDGFTYKCFADLSGGRADSSTACISHLDGERYVMDVLIGRDGKHSPRDFIEEVATLCREYRISQVEGDRYAGQFTVDAFGAEGIVYRPSQYTRSEIYKESLPLLTTGQALLLDSEVLRRQLSSLERKVGSSGRDTITHCPGSHDDYSNSAMGSLLALRQKGMTELFWVNF